STDGSSPLEQHPQETAVDFLQRALEHYQRVQIARVAKYLRPALGAIGDMTKSVTGTLNAYQSVAKSLTPTLSAPVPSIYDAIAKLSLPTVDLKHLTASVGATEGIAGEMAK